MLLSPQLRKGWQQLVCVKMHAPLAVKAIDVFHAGSRQTPFCCRNDLMTTRKNVSRDAFFVQGCDDKKMRNDLRSGVPDSCPKVDGKTSYMADCHAAHDIP